MKSCVPLRPSSIKELKSLLLRVKNRADLVEIWLDALAKAQRKDLKKILPKNSILLCRKEIDGGVFLGTWEDLSKVYISVLSEKPQYVDLSIHMPQNLLKIVINEQGRVSPNTKIILSYHKLNGGFSENEVNTMIKKLYKNSADIAKVAVNITKECENIVLLKILHAWKKKGKKLILHGIGEKGRWGRYAAAMLGSEISYVGLSKSQLSAPGQWTLEEWNWLVKKN